MARDERYRKRRQQEGRADRPKGRSHETMFLTDLDPIIDHSEEDRRLQPDGGSRPLQLGRDPTRTTKIAADLPEGVSHGLEKLLPTNRDLFAWSASDMPGVDPRFCSHHLTVDPSHKPVAQKKRQVSSEKRELIHQQTSDLLEAGIIREVKYTTLLPSFFVPLSQPRTRLNLPGSYMLSRSPNDRANGASLDGGKRYGSSAAIVSTEWKTEFAYDDKSTPILVALFISDR